MLTGLNKITKIKSESDPLSVSMSKKGKDPLNVSMSKKGKLGSNLLVDQLNVSSSKRKQQNQQLSVKADTESDA